MQSKKIVDIAVEADARREASHIWIQNLCRTDDTMVRRQVIRGGHDTETVRRQGCYTAGLCRSLVCDGEVFAGEFLVLVSYSVADCLVFLLLDYRLIILRSLMKYVFLNPVYSLIEAI